MKKEEVLKLLSQVSGYSLEFINLPVHEEAAFFTADNCLKAIEQYTNEQLLEQKKKFIEFLQSKKVENPQPAERVLNAILEQLIIDYQKEV